MQKTKILIIDDDPDIRDVLNITLTQEGYDVIEAGDGKEGLKLAQAKNPNLIIMLTGKGEIVDKVSGINAGADDYIVKPFEPQELLARIRMIIRRAARDLDANPLSRLPGNVSIISELQDRIDKKTRFAVCYIDLDKFKAYNDKYGFERGDELIKECARILIRSSKELGNQDDFVGHIVGDDFVIITTPDKVDALCTQIIDEFDKKSPNFYNEEDKNAGFILANDRQGIQRKISLTSISIGVVSNEKRDIKHVAEIGEIGAELKKQAKINPHSNYIKDLRTN